MKFLAKSHDGGEDSGVTGYWLIEWKSGFSIVLLRFSPNNREAYHSHAFNAFTWWLKGEAVEQFPNKPSLKWLPSFKWKYTPKNNLHRIQVKKETWALSIRGPWDKTWVEHRNNKKIVLTKHREVLEESSL